MEREDLVNMPIPLSESRDLSTANHYFPAMEHKHNNCEIILFVRGNPTNVANGRAEKMGIGDICFVSASAVHAILDASESHEHRDIYISLEKLEKLCLDLFDREFLDYLVHTQDSVKIGADSHEFAAILSRLARLEMKERLGLYDQNRNAYNICILSVIADILGMCYEEIHCKSDPPPGWLYEFTSRVKLPEYFTRSTAELIAMSGYSHTRFSEFFQRYYHMSFKHYLRELRMEYAKNLLTLSDKSILEISEMTGYASVSHFIRIFREENGISPLKYRKSHVCPGGQENHGRSAATGASGEGGRDAGFRGLSAR